MQVLKFIPKPVNFLWKPSKRTPSAWRLKAQFGSVVPFNKNTDLNEVFDSSDLSLKSLWREQRRNAKNELFPKEIMQSLKEYFKNGA